MRSNGTLPIMSILILHFILLFFYFYIIVFPRKSISTPISTTWQPRSPSPRQKGPHPPPFFYPHPLHLKPPSKNQISKPGLDRNRLPIMIYYTRQIAMSIAISYFFAFFSLFCIFSIDTPVFIDYNHIMKSFFSRAT